MFSVDTGFNHIKNETKSSFIFVLQVEASLTTDPENEDLLKLKRDLQVGYLPCHGTGCQISWSFCLSIKDS